MPDADDFFSWVAAATFWNATPLRFGVSWFAVLKKACTRSSFFATIFANSLFLPTLFSVFQFLLDSFSATDITFLRFFGLALPELALSSQPVSHALTWWRHYLVYSSASQGYYIVSRSFCSSSWISVSSYLIAIWLIESAIVFSSVRWPFSTPHRYAIWSGWLLDRWGPTHKKLLTYFISSCPFFMDFRTCFYPSSASLASFSYDWVFADNCFKYFSASDSFLGSTFGSGCFAYVLFGGSGAFCLDMVWLARWLKLLCDIYKK